MEGVSLGGRGWRACLPGGGAVQAVLRLEGAGKRPRHRPLRVLILRISISNFTDGGGGEGLK